MSRSNDNNRSASAVGSARVCPHTPASHRVYYLIRVVRSCLAFSGCRGLLPLDACAGPLPFTVYRRTCVLLTQSRPVGAIAQAHAVRSAGHAPEVPGQLPWRTPHSGTHARAGAPVRVTAGLRYRSVPVVALAIAVRRGRRDLVARCPPSAHRPSAPSEFP